MPAADPVLGVQGATFRWHSTAVAVAFVIGAAPGLVRPIRHEYQVYRDHEDAASLPETCGSISSASSRLRSSAAVTTSAGTHFGKRSLCFDVRPWAFLLNGAKPRCWEPVGSVQALRELRTFQQRGHLLFPSLGNSECMAGSLGWSQPARRNVTITFL